MNQDTWTEGKEVLTEYTRLNKLLQRPNYTAAVKADILDSIDKLNLKKSDESKFVILRQNRGRLLKRPTSGPPQVVAEGRNDWVGWLELKKEAVNEIATSMTAKVIQDVDADVLAVVEADDRIALCHFNDQLLRPINSAYRGIMLIDGNDDRGIDVGLFTKPKFPVEWIVSHVDDAVDGKTIFSRDCPEFTVRVSETKELLVIVNHFKSKGHGSQADSNAKRKAQAKRVKEIYKKRRAEGVKFIAIVGDLNDTPNSDPLSPLISQTDLKDIFEHDLFDDGGRPGTFANCTASNKIDYLLLSPELFAKVTEAGVFRKGIWGGVNGTLFPHYDEMTRSIHAASDHAAVWADVDID
jgi:endonuclease/exonuclease/phosphatase family metal-dependent hydrolase